jgi:hypothetical protein
MFTLWREYGDISVRKLVHVDSERFVHVAMYIQTYTVIHDKTLYILKQIFIQVIEARVRNEYSRKFVLLYSKYKIQISSYIVF